jgi:hypothetical protein
LGSMDYQYMMITSRYNNRLPVWGISSRCSNERMPTAPTLMRVAAAHQIVVVDRAQAA